MTSRRTCTELGRRGFGRRAKALLRMSYEFSGGDEDNINSDNLLGGRSMMTSFMYASAASGGDASAVGKEDVLYRDLLPQEELPQLADMPILCPEEERIETVSRRKLPIEILNSYDWSRELKENQFVAAPVTCFRHAPGYDIWPKLAINMKVNDE